MFATYVKHLSHREMPREMIVATVLYIFKDRASANPKAVPMGYLDNTYQKIPDYVKKHKLHPIKPPTATLDYRTHEGRCMKRKKHMDIDMPKEVRLSMKARCSVERLQSILNPDEAKHNRLIVNTYKAAVSEFCNGQSGNKIMIVAFVKDSSDPSGLIFLTKNGTMKPKSLAAHAVPSDMRTSTRKLMWEVSYCVRRVDECALCLGDILLSCAIEEVENRVAQDSHGASTYIWLVLAGGVSNLPALCLYLAPGFKIIVFYEVETEALVAVHNVGDDSTGKALNQVMGKVESISFYWC